MLHTYVHMLMTLPSDIKQVYMFSDTCSGQNWNIQMSMALLHACHTSKHLETIVQYMMESGYSQMECDSVRSTIESIHRHVPVYTPMDYYATARICSLDW